MKIKKGNDFKIRWAIFRINDGVKVAEDMTEAQNLSLKLISSKEVVTIITPTIADNVLTFEVTAAQQYVGAYRVELEFDKADPTLADGLQHFAADAEAFEIVMFSSEADTLQTGSLSVDVIELMSGVIAGINGLSAYEIAVVHGYTGTEAEWIEDVSQGGVEAVAAEQARKDAEALRVTAESARATAESSRGTVEAARVTAESGRVTAESSRATAETTRVSNESARATAESSRATAETGRANAESLRAGNETTRQSNETARVSAESTRATHEETRGTSEAGRMATEENRVVAETNRATAETNRVSAETNRANAETTRGTNEAARITAETARANAETPRATAESARLTAESGRATAETGRASAESARSTAEGNRVTAETARATAEGNRATAETDRANAESARATAETNRATAESSRVSAESSRVTAEGNRATAESARATAESSRVSAESTRATDTAAAISAANTAAATANQAAENAMNAVFDKVAAGLDHVDNTHDIDKPISTATQTALDGKVDETVTVNGHALSGNVTVTKGDVGLGNVDNTSDANKPVSTAQQSAIDTAISGVHTHTNKTTLDNITAAYTTAEQTKLAGIASGANNYVHPSGDGNLHAPATGTTNSGKVLTAGATAGSMSWASLPTDAATVSGHTVAKDVPADALFTDTVYTHPSTHSADMIVDGTTNKVFTATLKSSYDGAVSNSHTHSNKTVLDEITASYTTAEQTKLAGIATGANAYVHPAEASTGSGTLGHVTTEERTKLSGIAAGANNYVHPSTHSADIIVDGTNNKVLTNALKSSYDGAVTNSHTHSNKTTLDSITAAYTTAEQTKLSGIAAGANAYVHPSLVATGTGTDGHITTAERDTWNAKQGALGYTAENAANKNAVNGYAGLDASGKIDATALPAIAITDTFVVATQVAMLALTAEVGDVCVRTDLNKSFILKTAGASTLANWQELLTPTDVVTSVAGKTGAVSLAKADVGLGSVDNTADSAKNVLSATKLYTARTINGVSFDGTGNITVYDATKEPTITAGTTAQYYKGNKTWATLDKAAVGLGNVDNTSDANKPVSTAQATAIGAKADASALTSHTGNTTNPHSVTKAQVGLGNVDNTADASKPVATTSVNGLMSSTDKTKLDGVAAGANNYTHPASGATAGTYKSVTVDTNGHVTGGTNPTTLSGYGITDAFPNTGGAITGAAYVNRYVATTGFAQWCGNWNSADGWGIGDSGLVDNSVKIGVINTSDKTWKTGNIDIYLGSSMYKVWHSGNLGNVTTSVNGIMLSSDKTKLDGIATGANNYVHPDTHSADIIVDGTTNKVLTASLKTSYDGAVTNSHTHSNKTVLDATTASYTTAEQTKLSGVATGANNYTHPAEVETGSGTLGHVTTAERSKLAGIEAGANNYTHPSTHSADILVDGTTNKVFTSTLKTSYDGAVTNSHTHSNKTTLDSITAAYTTAEQTKLSGIATGANNYTHPSGDGNLHVPATGTTNSGKVLTAGATAGSLSWTVPSATDATKEPIITAGTTSQYWRGDKTWVTLDKTAVGLGSVDNTADSSKAVASAAKLTTARTINGVSFDGTANITVADSTKEPAITAGTAAQYYKGTKVWATLDKTAVGLGNVDNTADASKPVATTSVNGLMSSTDKTKLDGVASGANNYTHPSGDGNSHVPATSTTNNGKVLTAGSTANSATWATPSVDWSNVANKPSSTVANIDAAVTATHTHSNKTTLDSITAAYTTAEQTKLSGIEAGANAYTHPSTHSADIITDGTNNKVLTSALKTSYDGAVTNSHSHSNKTTLDSITAAYTTAEQTKLSGIATGANNYSHPTGDGNLHVPANGTSNSGKVLTAGASAGTYTWETPSGGSGAVTSTDDNLYNIADGNGKLAFYVDKNGFFKSKLNCTGKRLSIIGDSLSAYPGYIPSGYATFYPDSGGIQTVGQMWWRILCKETGMTLLRNCSWSGSTCCGDSTSTTSAAAGCSTKRINDLTDGTYNPDIVIIAIGANDLGGNYAMGTWDGTAVIPAESSSRNTFREAYALMVKKVMTAYPNARVFCCTMIDLGASPYDYNDANNFPTLNQNGDSMKKMNDAIRQISEALGAEIIDFHSCGINYFNLNTFTNDRLHPNTAGAVLIAKKAINEIKNKY